MKLVLISGKKKFVPMMLALPLTVSWLVGFSVAMPTLLDHATIVPYGRFRVGDGKHVMLGLQNEREWLEFCKSVLLRPELAADGRDVFMVWGHRHGHGHGHHHH